jgi:hypothetical protein
MISRLNCFGACALVAFSIAGAGEAKASGTGNLQSEVRTTNELMLRWDDALKLAVSTPRIGAANPVQNLQALKREAEGLELTSCLAMSWDARTIAMSLEVDAMLTFMQDGPEVERKAYLASAAEHNAQADKLANECDSK